MMYQNNSQYVKVSDNFIYLESIYILTKRRAELYSEKFFKSTKPIKITKKNSILKTKHYNVHRFIDLIEAPLDYLINNNFKKVL